MQLFYLVANSYQTNCKGVELLKQRGRDICWTFITDHAPLQLELDDAVKQRICEFGIWIHVCSCSVLRTSKCKFIYNVSLSLLPLPPPLPPSLSLPLSLFPLLSQ